MSATAKLFRFRVHDAGTAAPSDSTVDWSTTSLIADVPEIGGQRVEALEARTSARPWSVLLDDAEEAITAKLADATGRAQLLRRLADISVSTDGGSTYTVLQVGRIDSVTMEGVTRYRIEVTDERSVERSTTIFTGASTTRLAPSGLHKQWLHYPQAGPFRFIVTSVDSVNSRTTYDAIGSASPGDHRGTGPNPEGTGNLDGLQINDDVIELLTEDREGGGGWRTLRVNIDGTDREVRMFNGRGAPDFIRGLREKGEINSFVVQDYEDPGGVDQIRSCYFHMETHDPTEKLPLHIGGRLGIDPFSLVKAIYDGDYQDADSPATVRYDAECFAAYDPDTNPRGLIGRFPRQWYRITGPQNMAAWLQENVYTPLGVAPLLNAAGEVAPVVVRQPTAVEIPDPDELPTFNAGNSTEHATWENRGRDQVTVVRTTFRYALPAGGTDEERDIALDGFVEHETTLSIEHDNAASARAVHEVTVTGVQRNTDFREEAGRIAEEIFQRFGDGPIYCNVPAHAGDMEDVIPGAWVGIDFDAYPALQNQARGGLRIAQVLSRTILPAGIAFELLEAGPALQPLATPSVSVVVNSDDPHHSIDVTVSDIPAGANALIHVAAADTEPDEESDAWTYRRIRRDGAGGLIGNETVTISRLPSGTKFWVRVQSVQPDRISSDWSTADDASTTALTAPTSASVGDIEGGTATLSWTPGETDYDLIVDLDEESQARLVAGSTEYRFEGLPPSTSFEAGVKHVDDYGGESSRATDDFTSGDTDDDVPDMAGIRILVGETA